MTNTCPICHETKSSFANLSVHACPPAWVCWFDDGPDGYYEVEDGGTIVHADNARDAAALFTTQNAGATMDEWSYTIVVKTPDKDEWVKVGVNAEVEWYANHGAPEPFKRKPSKRQAP